MIFTQENCKVAENDDMKDSEDYQLFELLCKCKYHYNIPYIDENGIPAIHMLCTKGVKDIRVSLTQINPLCKDCIGKDCKDYTTRTLKESLW